MNPEFKQLIIIAVVLAALFFIGPAAADTAAFSVKINGDANVVNGEYYTFTAEVTPADSNVSIVWSSENPAVASVNADGGVTGNSVGRTTICVTASTADGKSASDAISVEVYDFVSDLPKPVEVSVEMTELDESMPDFAAAPMLEFAYAASEPSDAVTSIPSKFDLRNVNGKNYVSGVRNQGNWGSCWMFSSIASVESNLIMNGYADPSVDLSELQAIYYTFRLKEVTVDNPQPPLEGIWGDPGVGNGRTSLNSGGNKDYAYATFMNGIGLVNEATVPYSTRSTGMVLDPGYATEKNIYETVEFIKLSLNNRETVKKLLMIYGAAGSSLTLKTATVNGYTTSYNPNSGTNHAIAIVGWDDNFSKENFSSEPANDGAWLIKNSWGSSWGKMRGYVWVSYDDASISGASFVSAVPADRYEYIYQYDGGYCSSYYNSASQTRKNGFTAESDALISAVSFKVDGTDYDYRVSVVVNGIEKSVTAGHYKYGGYRHVVLDTPVYLRAGESFDTVVKVTGSNGQNIKFYCSGKGVTKNKYGKDFAIKAYAAATAHIPYAVSNLVYNGHVQTGVASGEGYTITGNTGTDAGTYTAVATLSANNPWVDGSTGTKLISWSIAKKPISVQTAASKLIYTGNTLTGISPGEGYTLTGTCTAVNPGIYTAVATLIDPQNYQWKDGTTAPKTIEWEITRKPVGIPTAYSGLVYNGVEQTGVKAYTGSTITGNTGTDAGTYIAEATLIDSQNYQWTDTTADKKSVSWHISKRTIIPKWPDTSSFVFDGNEHTFIPEIANIVENENVSLVTSGQTSAIQPGRYLVEITGITGTDAENYCLPVSLKQTKKNWNINYSGEGFCFITEVKETEKYSGGRIFAGTVSLDGLTDLIAGTAGFTLQASDTPIIISGIEPADAKSGWQFTVNSETGRVSLYGGKKTLTGKTPLVTFTARVPDTISFPVKITVVPESLVCGSSHSTQVPADLSGIAVISAEITENLSQSELTALIPDPPVITTDRILIPVCLENDIDFAGFMAVVANDIPGVSVEITDEEPIPGCSYSKNNPESSNLKICGFTVDPVYDSSIHLFTLKITVTDSSVTHITIPVVLEELISDSKGDAALDYVQTEYDIELDVDLERSLIQPVIEVKPFNAETRAEIDVTYQCPDSFIVELCDKDDCLVSVYRTNPAAINGASLLLLESSGFETYVKDIDYTYDDDGVLRFSEDRKSMPANEETFVFRSDYCLGDVNQDGKVTGADATAICSKLLDENSEWTREEVFYGKISGEANVPTVLDALNISKYAVGLVDADYKPVMEMENVRLE